MRGPRRMRRRQTDDAAGVRHSLSPAFARPRLSASRQAGPRSLRHDARLRLAGAWSSAASVSADSSAAVASTDDIVNSLVRSPELPSNGPIIVAVPLLLCLYAAPCPRAPLGTG